MSISEQEALARQLWVLFHEAIGDKDVFKPLADNEREAWIQVAQFVINSDEERLMNRLSSQKIESTIGRIISAANHKREYPMATYDPIDYPDHK